MSRQQPSVLIADDDLAQRTLLRAALEQVGFSVEEADSGTSALARFEATRPDLAILDVQMPGANGFEVCRTLRAQPGNAQVPIVMATGCEDTASINEAFEAGATDFISKPVNWDLIGHRVRYILRNAQTAQALQLSQADNAALLSAFPDQIYVLGQDQTVLRTLGARTGQSSVNDNLLPVPVTEALARRKPAQQSQIIEWQEGDGDAQHYFEARLIRSPGDRQMLIVRDVTERNAAAAEIHRLAYFDTLTGLPNRHQFLATAQALIDDQKPFSLLLIDLDRFKRINDTLGHQVGDEVLCTLSERIKSLAGSTESLARLGSDEFVFIAEGERSQGADTQLALELRGLINRPMLEAPNELVLTASIAIATYPSHGESLVSLLKRADTAMSFAKRRGQNSSLFYTSAMDAHADERLRMETDIRRALEHDEFELHFQPKYAATSERLVGAEALLRWQRTGGDWVSPLEILSVIEDLGLTEELDRWVIHRACWHQRRWQTAGDPVVPVAVNLASATLCEPELEAMLMTALNRFELKPQALALEITEGAIMSDARIAAANCSKLRERGFHIAVDDFGTGYSSLSYLKGLSLDALKIDQSFVRALDEEDGQSLCAAIIAMGQSLKLELIAEGVETMEQQQFLTALGVDTLQGYLLGRPLSAVAFAALLPESTPEAGASGR